MALLGRQRRNRACTRDPRQLLHQDRHADVVGVMRGGRRGEQDDLHDLVPGRAQRERMLDVAAQSALVEMRHRAVDRDIDEFAHLRLKVARSPGRRLEIQIGPQEFRAHVQKPLVERMPVSPLRKDVALELFAVDGHEALPWGWLPAWPIAKMNKVLKVLKVLEGLR